LRTPEEIFSTSIFLGSIKKGRSQKIKQNTIENIGNTIHPGRYVHEMIDEQLMLRESMCKNQLAKK